MKKSVLATLLSEVGGDTNIQAKQALFYNVNRNQRLGLSPNAGVATGLYICFQLCCANGFQCVFTYLAIGLLGNLKGEITSLHNIISD